MRDFLSYFNVLDCAWNCSALQRIVLETTVNRLVAGSNPARGAK